MVGSETDFVPNYPLFFTHRGRKKLYELLGVESHKEFMEYMNECQGKKGITEEIYQKMLYAGLIFKHPEITMEEVENLMEKFSLMGKGFEDLDDVLTDALVNSGIYNGEFIKTFREIKKQELSEEKIKEMLISVSNSQVADMGEQIQKLKRRH